MVNHEATSHGLRARLGFCARHWWHQHAAAPGRRGRPRGATARRAIVEVKKSDSAFADVQDSAFNRRITPLTSVTLSAAAAAAGSGL